MDYKKLEDSQAFGKFQGMVLEAEAIRLDAERPVDVTFAEMVAEEFEGMKLEDLFDDIGLDLGMDTVQNLFTTPSTDVRWLIPEIFRDALRLGYREGGIWPQLIKSEETVSGLNQVMPYLNMSASKPMRVNEGETIPLGNISYGSKKFGIHKFGRGIGLTDEVVRYVNLNVVSMYLEDFGAKMAIGVDNLAINTLINGEQTDGSEAAPVIGVATPNTLAFRDILKIWIRMSKIGRKPALFLGGEDMALDTWDLDEFNMSGDSAAAKYKLNVKTPLPQGADYYIHAGVNANQHLIIDPSSALLKFNAVPLQVESERIVSNQTSRFYASFTTGFAKMFTDACLIQDKSKDFADEDYNFPAEMDVYAEMLTDMNDKNS